MANYPEQNDIIMTNVLLQFGLNREGEDTAGGSATMKQKDDEGQIKMREAIKARTMHGPDMWRSASMASRLELQSWPPACRPRSSARKERL